MVKRVLFVCEENLHRSPTAAALYAGAPGLEVRSAGLSSLARVELTEELLAWADVVFVMESRLLEMLRGGFRPSLAGKEVVSLDVPDHYLCMQPELLAVLTEKLTPHLGPPAGALEKHQTMNESELKALEGLATDDARQRVQTRGLVFRVRAEDGVRHAGTADYRTDRVNVEVALGKVVSATIG